MSSYSETTTRSAAFYRDADRALVGGVCAGLAGHFGLNLKVTRFLMILAFLMATPFAIIAYLGAVLLIPAESRGGAAEASYWTRCRGHEKRAAKRRAGRRRSQRAAEQAEDAYSSRAADMPRSSLKQVRDRYRDLDKRLAELERQVTSPRFQLEQEFRKL